MPIKNTGDSVHTAPAPLTPGAFLHEIFSARAREFPERTAVSDATRTLSYAQLDALSSKLAARLRHEGVKDGLRVGMYLPRSVDLVISLLGILKAGGAYVPVDPQYPGKRVEHIVRDSGLGLVIGDAANLPKSPSLRVLALDQLLSAPELELSVDGSRRDPDQATAYVIYTSGSTGEPKGVQVAHGNVSRLLESTQRNYGFNAQDIWSMFHSIGFDFSVWEIWGALAHGGQVAVVPYEVSRSPVALRQWLSDQRVTVLSQTPSAFRGLDEADRGATAPLALRYVVFGGEALPATVLRPWVERHGDQKPALINMYGITEATVHSTFKRVLGQDLENTATVSVGKPLDGWRLHLLDSNQTPVPQGTAGELYIEGAGVAQGYLNRTALNAERFIQLPGTSIRTYRTGDLLVLDPDGEYRYAGRCDEQLKISGFRIEPGEIEACLQTSPSVAAAHVAAHDYGDGDLRLVAYVVPTQGLGAWTEQTRGEVAALAATSLPDYMRPSAYLALTQLPVTAHGKIDKKQLPSPTTGVTPSHATGTQGVSEPEQFVLKVWGEDLGLKNIGLNDDFFDFGGTSLALIRSLGKLKAHYQINLDPGVLANGATAKVLAEHISRTLAPQQFVLKVWSEDLGLKNIGLNDDFFDFGGTSLALIRSLGKLKAHYQINLDPGVLANGATAKALAEHISRTLVQAH
ncbi:amino acid adenylation domain-containing protein [Pseudomonas batumici]|uniref:Long-chain-fatty-acid--CoA ligase n=1 Tax=Pseudomonas batumici TaxID=226910 RepID=A0A0C2EUZ0_9PSED|nr:amino acid adenylation domain-containing protein [Pseudomonas batumici]KIH82458.1 Long-chain-fatty-acid--CoA ligase [Pseudomonas batumici]